MMGGMYEDTDTMNPNDRVEKRGKPEVGRNAGRNDDECNPRAGQTQPMYNDTVER